MQNGYRPRRPRQVAQDLLVGAGMVMRLEDGRTTRIGWEQVREVAFVAEDAGPEGLSVYVVIVADDNVAYFISPWLVTRHDLLKRLQSLPGFDAAEAEAKMYGSREDYLVAWRRPAA